MGGVRNFIFLKFPRYCPLVLLVKVGWKRGKPLGIEECKSDGKLSLGSMQQRKKVGHLG
jgi:hypothetical protein